MIWTPERNKVQGLLIADLYGQADDVACERNAVMAGGLRGADKASALAQQGIDPTLYLTISIDDLIEEMAARELIPRISGLSPLDAADLVHAEAQFLAKRLGLRALADGRNLIWDITMASAPSVEPWLSTMRLAGYAATGIFVEIDLEESVRRSEAEHRRGHDEYRNGRGYGGRYVAADAIRALADTPAGARRCAAQTALIQPSAAPGDRPFGSFRGAVTGRIAAYITGGLTLDALAEEFRTRCWPDVPSVCPPGMEAAAPAIDDPEPSVPGSFDDVVLAYDLGWLTDADYAALAEAAVCAPRRRRPYGCAGLPG